MRYEQFEIEVDIECDLVSIYQDSTDGEPRDIVNLSVGQIPAFIAALNAEIAKATKGD